MVLALFVDFVLDLGEQSGCIGVETSLLEGVFGEGSVARFRDSGFTGMGVLLVGELLRDSAKRFFQPGFGPGGLRILTGGESVF